MRVKLPSEAEGAFVFPYFSPLQTARKLSIQGGNIKSKPLKSPQPLARGPLGLWYSKIDLLNQTLINILQLVTRANAPKTLWTEAQFVSRAAGVPNQIRTITFRSTTAVARRMN